MSVYLFLLLLCCVGVFVLILGQKAWSQGKETGRSLSLFCFSSFAVIVLYVSCLFVTDYFWYSLVFSLKQVSVILTLLCLFRFIILYTDLAKTGFSRNACRLLIGLGLIDAVLLMINPFGEFFIHFTAREAEFLHFSSHETILYSLHLLLINVIVLLSIVELIRRIVTLARLYRAPYTYILAGIILVSLANICHMLWPDTLDLSLVLSALQCGLLYWCAFRYNNEYLPSQFHSWIFTRIEQGFVLFDHNRRFLLSNEKAARILPKDLLKNELTLENFLYSCNLSIERDMKGDHHSTQCYINDKPLRCDYSTLYDERSKVLGHLFVLTPLDVKTDLLTGFSQLRYLNELVDPGRHSSADRLTVVVCDIKHLTEINQNYSYDYGNRAIRIVSENIRKIFPANSLFFRAREAIMVILLRDTDEEQLRSYLADLESALRYEKHLPFTLQVQTAVGISTPAEALDITIENTIQALGTKKLMDHSSVHSELLNSLMQALEQCDPTTDAHVHRTQLMSLEMGKKLGLTQLEQNDLALLAILHDIGKIGIPLEILNKPGRLTISERQILESHVYKGYEIAKSSHELSRIAEMILYHHERWDGKGYPDGLSKESIPLLSRIISIVDSFDAMINDRPYKKGMSVSEAINELKRCAGVQFDPTLVASFLEILAQPGWNPENYQSELKPETPSWSTTMESPSILSTLITDTESDGTHWIFSMPYTRYTLDQRNMQILSVDDNFEELTGYSPEDVRESLLTQIDLIFEEDRSEYFAMVKSQLDRYNLAFLEHRLRHKSGVGVYVFCLGRTYFDSALQKTFSEIFVVNSAESRTIRSIAAQEHNRAALRLKVWEDKYRRDPLTELLTREAFQNEAEEKLLNDTVKAAMIMIDLDHFKEYNDTYGHHAGDAFLILTAQSISSAVDENGIAGRMGGDEFAVMLFFEADAQDAHIHAACQRVWDKVNMYLNSQNTHHGTLSMGMAVSTPEIHTFTTLYEAADAALYRAKDGGRAKLSE